MGEERRAIVTSAPWSRSLVLFGEGALVTLWRLSVMWMLGVRMVRGGGRGHRPTGGPARGLCAGSGSAGALRSSRNAGNAHASVANAQNTSTARQFHPAATSPPVVDRTSTSSTR